MHNILVYEFIKHENWKMHPMKTMTSRSGLVHHTINKFNNTLAIQK